MHYYDNVGAYAKMNLYILGTLSEGGVKAQNAGTLRSAHARRHRVDMPVRRERESEREGGRERERKYVTPMGAGKAVQPLLYMCIYEYISYINIYKYMYLLYLFLYTYIYNSR